MHLNYERIFHIESILLSFVNISKFISIDLFNKLRRLFQ